MNKHDYERPIAPIVVDRREMTIEEFESLEYLLVYGWLHLIYTGVTKLPKKLRVCGSLEISRTSITELPKDLYVEGSVFLHASSVTKLPENMHVCANLYLGQTEITELPRSLYVGKMVDLHYSKIKPIGVDERGHKFFPVHLANGPRVIAACRNFSPAEARAHWPEGTECRMLAERCIAALEASA
jgi:hypothetical protein